MNTTSAVCAVQEVKVAMIDVEKRLVYIMLLYKYEMRTFQNRSSLILLFNKTKTSWQLHEKTEEGNRVTEVVDFIKPEEYAWCNKR